MNGEHNHPHPGPTPPPSGGKRASAEQRPPTEDTGAQALAEALRSSFGLIKIVMVALVGVFLVSNFFIVGPTERALILRLGKPLGAPDKVLLGPGLHFALPYPVDVVKKIPISEIQRVDSTVGWYATTPEQERAGTEPPANPSLHPAVDSYAISADGNILHTRAALYYRIHDPARFILDFANATNALQSALDNALISTAARFTVDDILNHDIVAFKEAVRRRLTEHVEAQRLGVTVEQCDIESRAPRFLKDAFNQVLQSEVERSKKINEARSYENQVVSRAGADAASRKNLAESERARHVQSVAAEAERFKNILPEYDRSPDLFIQKSLTEVIGRVMTNAQDKIYLAGRPDERSRELRLLLNREPLKAKPSPAAPGAAPATP